MGDVGHGMNDRRRNETDAQADAHASARTTGPLYPPQTRDYTFASIDDAVAQISARQRALEVDPLAPRPAPQGPVPPMNYPYPSDPYAMAPRPHPYAPAYPPQTYAQPPYPPQYAPAPDLSRLEAQLRNITAQIETLRQPADFSSILKELRQDLNEISQRLMEAMPRRAIEALEAEVHRLAERIDFSRNAGVDPDSITSMDRSLNEVRDALRSLKPAESFAGFERAIQNLSEKIDQAGSTYQDPASLRQLETAIQSLRGVAANVASNEALARLAEEVRGLSDKVDRVAAVSNTPEQMALLEEQLANSPILGAIERGFAELRSRLDALQVPAATSDPIPAVDFLKRDLGRTQDSLEAVHSTLGHLVDRLAMIEGGIREARLASESPAPLPPKSEAPSRRAPAADMRPAAPELAAPTPAAQPAASQHQAPQVPRERQPIDPKLPPDHPLEPGSGSPRNRPTVSAAERIAASEAALGGVAPASTGLSGHTDFIAAARRAAQAAASATSEAIASQPEQDKENPTKSISDRMRTLFVGACAAIIVVAAVRVGIGLFDDDGQPIADLPAPAELDTAEHPASSPATTRANDNPALAQPQSPNTFNIAPSGVITPQRAQPALQPPAQIPDPDATGSIPSRSSGATETSGARDPLPPLPEKLPAALRNAALKGQPAADYEIGIRLLDGIGLPQNSEEGIRWLERAARAGLAPAHFRLGGLHEKGIGVKKNLNVARRHYVAAAEKGHAKAMHNLAVLYAEGIDGKPDYKTAAQWFQRAAEHGIADSQYNLGILYARGIGIDQNLTESYKWFSLAALQGDRDAANKRDDVAARLDPGGLSAARAAAQSFVARPQPDEAITVSAPPGGWDRSSANNTPARKPRAGSRLTAL